MLHVRILTTEKTVYDDHVDEIIVPTTSGIIGVRAHHVSLITIVKAGEMIVRKGETRTPFAVSGGILEIRPGSQAIILADDSEHARDISIADAEKAYERARIAMENKEHAIDVDFARFERDMLRELNRLKVARKWQ
jgi:F-type H+-transporting ATPase subunit epsilon